MIPDTIYAIKNKTWSTTPPNENQKLKRELFVKAESKSEICDNPLAKQIELIISQINEGYLTNQEAIQAIQKLI